MQRQTVTGLDADGLSGRADVRVELRVAGEQPGGDAVRPRGRAVVAVVMRHGVVTVEADEPPRVAEVATGDVDLAAIGDLREGGQIGGNRIIQRLPLELVAVDAHGLDGLFGRVHEHGVDVVDRVVGEHAFIAGRDVMRQEPQGVGVVVCQQVEGSAVAAEADGSALVVGSPVTQRSPRLVAAIAQEQFVAAVVGTRQGGADLQFPRRPGQHRARIARVQPDRSVAQVDAKDIHTAAVLAVEGGEDDGGLLVVQGDQLGPHAVEGRQVAHGTGGDVEQVEMEVFVAVGILLIDQMVGQVGPVVDADAAAGVVRQRPILSSAAAVGRGALEPDLEHAAIIGGQIRQPPAVGRKLWAAALRMTEQQRARDQGYCLGVVIRSGIAGVHGGLRDLVTAWLAGMVPLSRARSVPQRVGEGIG